MRYQLKICLKSPNKAKPRIPSPFSDSFFFCHSLHVLNSKGSHWKSFEDFWHKLNDFSSKRSDNSVLIPHTSRSSRKNEFNYTFPLNLPAHYPLNYWSFSFYLFHLDQSNWTLFETQRSWGVTLGLYQIITLRVSWLRNNSSTQGKYLNYFISTNHDFRIGCAQKLLMRF